MKHEIRESCACGASIHLLVEAWPAFIDAEKMQMNIQLQRWRNEHKECLRRGLWPIEPELRHTLE